MYRRGGPWPQPSPVHPFGESPGVIHVPWRENLDWWLWVGSRYVATLALSPYFFLKACFQPGLKAVSDDEFEDFFNYGMLSKFLSKKFDDLDHQSFDGLSQDDSKAWYIVDFTAVWCGPCKSLGPVFVKMADEFTNIEFVKVDVDEAEEIAASQAVSAMPTFKFYKGGAKIDELVGANAEKLKALCAKYN